jgi:hypothetical protein
LLCTISSVGYGIRISAMVRSFITFNLMFVESTGALFCGAFAGTLAKTVLYPLDLIRHRLQVFQLKFYQSVV